MDAGVPAWIVNVNLRQVEFHGSAADLNLKHGNVFAQGTTFEVLGVEVAVADLFDDARTTESPRGRPTKASECV